MILVLTFGAVAIVAALFTGYAFGRAHGPRIPYAEHVKLSPGDQLVVTTTQRLTMEQKDQIREAFTRDYLAAKNPIVIFDGTGLGLKVIEAGSIAT